MGEEEGQSSNSAAEGLSQYKETAGGVLALVQALHHRGLEMAEQGLTLTLYWIHLHLHLH